MSSYNRLNSVYTSNQNELLNDILREWGYRGMIMTDWGTCSEGLSDPSMCIKAGNDLIMSGSPRENEVMLQSIKSGELTISELRLCAARILRLIRETAIQ